MRAQPQGRKTQENATTLSLSSMMVHTGAEEGMDDPKYQETFHFPFGQPKSACDRLGTPKLHLQPRTGGQEQSPIMARITQPDPPSPTPSLWVCPLHRQSRLGPSSVPSLKCFQLRHLCGSLHLPRVSIPPLQGSPPLPLKDDTAPQNLLAPFYCITILPVCLTTV